MQVTRRFDQFWWPYGHAVLGWTSNSEFPTIVQNLWLLIQKLLSDGELAMQLNATRNYLYILSCFVFCVQLTLIKVFFCLFLYFVSWLFFCRYGEQLN